MRPTLLAVLAFAIPAVAAEKVVKNDVFTGSGGIVQQNFAEYQGAHVILTPAPGDYPAVITDVDIFCVPNTGTMGGALGIYQLDVWDEKQGPFVVPNLRPDGGAYPMAFASGIQLTASVQNFNRFPFNPPIVIDAGSLHVTVREQKNAATINKGTSMDLKYTILSGVLSHG